MNLYKILGAIILFAFLAFIAFFLLLPAHAAPPPAPLPMDFMAGASEVFNGTVTTGAASVLTVTQSMNYVIVNNRTGSTAYVVFNDDTGTPTASTTVFDAVLDDGEDVFINGWLAVENLSVYVTPAVGFRAVGW